MCTRVSHARLPSYIEFCRLCKSSCAQKRTLLCMMGTHDPFRHAPARPRSAALQFSTSRSACCTIVHAKVLLSTGCCEAGRSVCLLDFSTAVYLELLMEFALTAHADCAALSRRQHADKDEAGSILQIGLANLLFICMLLIWNTHCSG